MGILQRWFNLPYYLGEPFITDKNRRKFWVAWEEFRDGASLYISYHGFPTGNVNLLWDEDREKYLILADIFVSDYHHPNIRQQGLGKAMLKETIRWAREKGAIGLWGCIQPHDGASKEYLAEWYQRQGFRVETEESKHYIFLPL
jgi:GNAT superfamily N-acetyltransferase